MKTVLWYNNKEYLGVYNSYIKDNVVISEFVAESGEVFVHQSGLGWTEVKQQLGPLKVEVKGVSLDGSELAGCTDKPINDKCVNDGDVTIGGVGVKKGTLYISVNDGEWTLVW